ncbi:uncharacterized protein LOC114321863 isoform X1 [Camellia sinensis]|uniref:uncharacterized protein LOC114321863 isoform X1 n=1 Tax=Camellia sinensis TaxID=4442 RepID=UPI0010358533|nr:uncharacterized protein LOC114321863 isoform X1 [Camellia sinensis]
MMVGDNLKDDVSSALFLSPSFAPYLLRTFLIHFEVACGKRAGAFTCLLDKTGRYSHLIQLTIPEIRNYFIKALTRPNPDNRGCRQLLLNSRF